MVVNVAEAARLLASASKHLSDRNVAATGPTSLWAARQIFYPEPPSLVKRAAPFDHGNAAAPVLPVVP
jgi:hypothetical protein